MTLEPTTIFIIVLVAAGIWAVIELALTIRKARASLTETLGGVNKVITTANEAIEQAQPIIGKIDGTMDDIEPSIKEIYPLIERVETTVDVATVSLAKVNDILGDVSEVSGSAASVSATVKNVTSNAANNMAGAVGRFSRSGGHDAAKLSDGGEQRQRRSSRLRREASRKMAETVPDPGYVTYSAAAGEDERSEAADDAE